MSATSKHKLRSRAETTFGAWFGGFGAGTVNENPHTSWTMDEALSYTESQTINASRDPQDQILVDQRCAGQLAFELSYESITITMIGNALLNDANATAADSDTDTTYALSQLRNSLVSSDAGLVLEMPVISGDHLRISGFTTNAADMIVKVEAVYITGTYATEAGSLTDRSGATEGDHVTGSVSGATGTLEAIDTGANTYTVRVLTGQFAEAEEIYKTTSAPGVDGFDDITIDSAVAELSNYKVATEAEGASITVRRLSNLYPGSTQKSRSFESFQSDLSTDYSVWLGCMFTRLSLNFPQSGPVTGVFDIKGSTRVLRTTRAGASTGGTPLNDGIFYIAGNPVLQKENVDIFMGGSGYALTALSATSADATTVCTTTLPHGLQTGDLIIIKDNADSDNNRNWLVTRVTSTTFTLQGSSAQTAQTGSDAGVFRKLKVRKSIESATWTLDNQLREETELGVRGIVAQPIGTLAVNGTLEIYHANQNEQLRYQGDEYHGIEIVVQEVQDPTHIYVFDCPRIKYTSAPSPIDRGNESRRQSISWGAAKDSGWQRAFGFHF